MKTSSARSPAVHGGEVHYDYSQQPRFVLNRAVVDGREMTLAAALAESATATLFSDEGVIAGAMLRY